MDGPPTDDERKDLFKETARMGKTSLSLSVVLFVASLTSGWLSNTAMHNDRTEPSYWSAFVAFGLFVSAVWWFLSEVSTAKEKAVKQCLVVADKHNIPLTSWQVRSLESSFAAMWVFQEFVEIVVETKATLVPVGTFVGSGGQTGEACRNLVRYLWNAELQEEQVEEESGSPQALAT